MKTHASLEGLAAARDADGRGGGRHRHTWVWGHHPAVIRSLPGFFLYLSPNKSSPIVPIVTSLFQIPQALSHQRIIARKDFRLQTELGTEADLSQVTTIKNNASLPRLCFINQKQHVASPAQDLADTKALHAPAPWHWTYVMDRDASPSPRCPHTQNLYWPTWGTAGHDHH